MDGSSNLITLRSDEKSGLTQSLDIAGKTYQFEYAGKPWVENLNGIKVVGKVEQSLHQITFPQEMGGKKETFDFAVESTSSMIA